MPGMKIGDISPSSFRRVLSAARALGADTEKLLQKAEISSSLLADPEERLGLLDYMKLGHVTIQETGRHDLGLVIGTRSTVTNVGYAGLAAMAAPDLRAALQTLCRYEPLVTRCYRGSSRLMDDGGMPTLRFYSIAPYNNYNRFVVDTVLTTWVTLIEWLTGRQDLVRSLSIEFPRPAYAQRYQQLFRFPVQFGQEGNFLALAPDALQAPVLFADPLLYGSLLAQCDMLMSRLVQSERFTHRVQKVLGPMLHGKTPTIEETAERLNMPAWTLRRKLKEEDTSFQILLDNMRKDLALGYMRDRSLSFGEIAYILGFSTPGAFQRAFKRWTGTTPGDYRKALESDTQRGKPGK